MDGYKGTTTSSSGQQSAKKPKKHFFQVGHRKVNTWFVLLGTVMISLLIFSLGGGGITGSVVQAEELSENVVDVVDRHLAKIDSDFKGIKAEIEQCLVQRNELDSVLQVAAKEFNSCVTAKDLAEADKLALEQALSQFQGEYQVLLDSREAELLEVQSNFEEVIDDAARRICCKERVDNSNINSFTFVNNEIECVNGGSFELQC